MFYIYPAIESTSKRKKVTHMLFAVMVFTGNFLAAVAHVVYLSKYMTTNVKGSIFAFMGVSAYGCVTYITASVFILRKQISSILNQLSAIYDAREYKCSSSQFYTFHREFILREQFTSHVQKMDTIFLLKCYRKLGKWLALDFLETKTKL